MAALVRFRSWYYWLLGANILKLLVGLLVAFFGDSALFELHNRGTQQVFFDSQPLPENVLAMKKWLFGVIGGTIVGFHTLAIFIIRFAFLKKETLVVVRPVERNGFLVSDRLHAVGLARCVLQRLSHQSGRFFPDRHAADGRREGFSQTLIVLPSFGLNLPLVNI